MLEKKKSGRKKQDLVLVQILLTPKQIEWLDLRANQMIDSRSGTLRRLLQALVEANPIPHETT
jgi:hypothetical protein